MVHGLTACAILVVACSPTSSPVVLKASCDAASICPSDVPETQAEGDACRAALAGPCQGAYQDYIDCYARQRVCAYDGMTDVLATQMACNTERSALSACGDGGAD